MSDDRSRREREVFEAALDRPADQRRTFLNTACDGDPDLLKRVERLLSAHEHSGFTASPLTDKVTPAEGQPTRIGPYRILQRLGEGGMGVVYVAEQRAPIHRRVALKVVKLGMDTKEVIARFESERQALALMNHPGIASILDAGETEEGRPYFVMEYVPGVSIVEYCDDKRLRINERLCLFTEVCRAVQHAHQKGVIHRDLKPSNILVAEEDGIPLIKVIDFGVAKATSGRLGERTLHTELGRMIGTPEYMSPEQAEMTTLDVDTRSDVYSLGVLLYELLVGTRPLDLSGKSPIELQRTILEQEPVAPSKRLRTDVDAETAHVADKRGTSVGALRRRILGELESITLCALSKDRRWRYQTALAFAEDVERHLRGETVRVSSPSSAYRLRKFVRRHTLAVAAAATGVLVLLAFAGAMAVLAKRIAAERDVARQAQADLESVVAFQAGMLSEMDTEGVGRRMVADLRERVAELRRSHGDPESDVEAAVESFEAALEGLNTTEAAVRLITEEILDRALETLEGRFAEQPLIDARLRSTIGMTYRRLGRYERAEPQLEAALATQRRVLGDEHPDTLQSMTNLASLYTDEGLYDEAELLHLEKFETTKRVFGDEHPVTLRIMSTLANLYLHQGRHAEAEPLYVQAIEGQKRFLGDDHRHTLKSVSDLAYLYMIQERYEQAEIRFQAALATQKRVLGDDDPETLWTMSLLASMYVRQERYDEAEQLHSQTLEARKRVLGDSHPDTLKSMNLLANLYLHQAHHDAAEPLFLEAVETQIRILGDDHPDTLSSMKNLAYVYMSQGRHEEAETLLLETLEAHVRVRGETHEDTLEVRFFLSELYKSWGRGDEAEGGTVTRAHPSKP